MFMHRIKEGGALMGKKVLIQNARAIVTCDQNDTRDSSIRIIISFRHLSEI